MEVVSDLLAKLFHKANKFPDSSTLCMRTLHGLECCRVPLVYIAAVVELRKHKYYSIHHYNIV